jgi:16S rRNA (uracil1498-N3)-methyltransferase
MAQCVITSARAGVLELAVLARQTQPAPQPRIVVVQAIPKGDRGEQAVETMTEVGVDVVVPWAAERCMAVWRADRADKGLARWRSTALQAAKQSRRAWFPEVTPVAQTSAVTELVRRAALALLLDPDAAQPLANVSSLAPVTQGAVAPRPVSPEAGALGVVPLGAGAPRPVSPEAGALGPVSPEAGAPGVVPLGAGALGVVSPEAVTPSAIVMPGVGDIVLLVGPEGGISPQESALLIQAGAVGVRLGPTVLRASSAGAAAAALVMSASGRWS